MKVSKVCAKIFLSVSSLLSDITLNITNPFHKIKIVEASHAKVTLATAIKRNLVAKLCNLISPLVISFFLFRLLSHHYLAHNNGSCIPDRDY